MFSAFVVIPNEISIEAAESTIETDESDDDFDEHVMLI